MMPDLFKLLQLGLPYVKQLKKKLRSYEGRVEELNKCVYNLKKQRKKVKRIVEEQEIRYGRGIDEDVLKWLKDVDEIISMYENFNGDEDHPYAVCSKGYLPKPGIRCRLSRIVNDITSKVYHLQEAPKHDAFSYWLGLPFFDFDSSNIGYQSYPSRERALNDIKEALEDLRFQVIGVYGWNGVGKTTLVKEVAKKVKDSMFNMVIMVTVANSDIREIQGQIADRLGMKLEEESNSGRAARIRERLKNPKENTVIILDDLREKLDFNIIGIPFAKNDDSNVSHEENHPPDFNKTETKKYGMEAHKFDASSSVKTKETLTSYKGCKVLLISDSKQLLLSQVDWKGIETYCVGVLEEKEAEKLFKHMAEIHDESSQFATLATQIAKKCGGLPMTIVTTARALRNKSLTVWEGAYEKLEKKNLKPMPELSTNLSYDLLEDDELKHTLLICSSMGQDALISDLVRYCIGLGLLQDIYSVREARIRVRMLVEKLKELSLLSDSFSSDRFTMQDIVRRATLSISSKEMHAFSLIKGKLDEWPDKDKLERYTAISLQHCDINEFPENIICPKLRVFDVDNNDPHIKIPDNFFYGKEELRVLRLTGIDLCPLPVSIKNLSKLRMLCLERCKLGEGLSILGELKKLRVLSFSGSDIDELPDELKQLVKLQIFDLSHCSKLRVIPANVLSCMTSLEELYMRNTLIQWDDKGKKSPFEKEKEGMRSQSVTLSELSQLHQLRALDIQIPNIVHLPKNLFFDKLDSYKITIGEFNAYPLWHFKMQETYEASRLLALHQENGFDIHSQKAIKILFEEVENLLLGQLNDVEDIFYDLNCQGFPNLKYLSIVTNSTVKSIINSVNQQHHEKAFPQLESLFLYEVNMKHICRSQLIDESFSKLKIIKLKMCGQLKNVFFFSMIKHFCTLETIEVSECNSLKEIVTLETQSNEEDIRFPELLSLTLQSLSKFIGFCTLHSSTGEHSKLFDKKVVVSKLERLKLSSIKIHKIWSDQSSTRSCFQNLTHLDVNDCGSLKYLLSFSMAKSLTNLQSLFISECTMMEDIVKEDHIKVEAKESIIFPKLKYINLSSMKRLKKIWHSKVSLDSFGKLDTLIVEGCNKLENVFPSYMVGRFPSLSTLKVADCKSMKEIFDLKDCGQRHADDETNLQNVQVAALPKLEHIWNKDPKGILNFKNLQKIWVQQCPNLKSIFPASRALSLEKLEYLEVWDCGELEDIVDTRETGNSISYKLPKLNTARFSKLPKLKSFYGEQEISCLALNDLSLQLCHKLELFRTAEPETRQVFLPEKVIYSLKSMQIELRDANWLKRYIGNYRMHKLEELHLSKLKDTQILYFLLYRNPNLKSVMLSNCFFNELVPPPSHHEEGVVPKLNSLKLINLPSLEKIGFEEDPIFQRIECLILKECSSLITIAPSSVSFTCLTYMEVSNCNGLIYLLVPSTAKSLVQLTCMKVSQCESMQSIVPQEAYEEIKIVFRQLKEIELVSLHKLRSFCSSKSYTLEFPSLEKFTVSACGKMRIFSDEPVKCTPVLQQIYVRHGKEETRSYWKGDLNATISYLHRYWLLDSDMMAARNPYQLLESFQLKTLKLMNCKLESHAIPTAVFPTLKNLEELVVCGSSHVKVIFGESDIKMKGNTFPLKKLTLDTLPNLNNIWDGDHDGILSFQNLQQVFVTKCENLKTLFTAELAKHLEKLHKLEISSCGQLINVVEEEDPVIEATEELSFPRLTSLALRKLPRLVSYHPPRFTLECPELNHLEVLFCNELEAFPCQQVAQVSTSASRQPHFFHVEIISSLESLKLDWKNANMLCREHVPEDVLHKLVALEVDFDDVEHKKPDFDDFEHKKPDFDDFEHKKPDFDDFEYKKPDFDEVTLKKPDFDDFEHKKPDFDDVKHKKSDFDDVKLTKPDFDDVKLKKLDFDDVKHKKLEFDDVKLKKPEFDDVKLKKPEFDDNNEVLSFPIELLKKAFNIEYLQVSQCRGVEELFPSQPKEGKIKMLGHLCKKLHLLSVYSCPYLTTLVYSAVSFSNLKQLSIQACEGLRYLFTSSTAKELVHLEEMYIVHCESLKEILAKDADETTSEAIKFERLNTIILDSLQNLQCFYPGTNTLQLPSLIKLLIWQCPNMKTFSQGAITTDSFLGIHVTWDQNEDLLFHQDLNNSVKRMILIRKKKFLEGMDDKTFSKYLKQAWRGEVSLQSLFDGLRTMKLVNCEVQECLISSDLFPCLKNLKELEVRDCNKVKVIFDIKDTEIVETAPRLQKLTLQGLSELTHVWEINCEGIRSFQNLQDVIVEECENLQTVFPSALAKNLTMLENVIIKSCGGLIEIVGKAEDTATGIREKFVLPRLTSLWLENLPRLTCFYHDTFTLECPVLKALTVRRCLELELFSSAHSMDKGDDSCTSINRQHFFSDLKTIPILENVILDWKHSSMLQQLMEDLKWLKKIELLFDGDENENYGSGFLIHHLQDPDEIGRDLEVLTSNQVSDLHLQSFWSENTLFEKLYKLHVNQCPHLTALIHSTSTVSFSNLKVLHIYGCGALKYLFRYSAAQKLKHLKEIKVEECESMKEIVAKEQEEATSDAIVLEQLSSINLTLLSNLKCFYSGNATLQLPSLTQVNVRRCPKMKIFSHGLIGANSFQGIESRIYSIDEFVFHIDLNSSVKRLFLQQKFRDGIDQKAFSKHVQQAWHGEVSQLQNNLFHGLKVMKLVDCEVQPCAIPSHILKCLKSLIELKVKYCNKVKVIFDIKDKETVETVCQLQGLTLEGLSELTHVWDINCEGILNYQNMQRVSVQKCKNLKTLFPASLAKILNKLESLEIDSCGGLIEIVGNVEDAEVGITEKFVFPSLTLLRLQNLPRLRYFYHDTFILECPILNALTVRRCLELELFSSAHSKDKGDDGCTSIYRQPFFSDLKTITILENVILDWKHSSMLQQLMEDLKWLKKIELLFDGDENKNYGSGFLIHLLQHPDEIGRDLEVLTSNQVSDLHLQSFWSENTLFEKLYQLNVNQCPHLTALVNSTSTVSFSNLKVLHIYGCGALKYLFTYSAAQKLMHLKEIKVEECKSMKEIVAKEQEVATSEAIVLEQLSSINLTILSNLKCFYSGSATLQLPSLTQVKVQWCPQMKIFSHGLIEANSFQGIESRIYSMAEFVFHIDLNSSVKGLFLQKKFREGMDEKAFSKHVQQAWHGEVSQLQNNLFHGLKVMKLVNCEVQPCAIPSHILKCLKSLIELEVMYCNKVKVIFDIKDIETVVTVCQLQGLTLEGLSELTHVWENNSEGILSFQNMQRVTVQECKNLKTLFPASLAKILNKLENLVIESCGGLIEIVGKAEDTATGIREKFVLPRLTSLWLQNLPRLRYFYHDTFTLECPALQQLTVWYCLELELFSSAHPNGKDSSTSVNEKPLFSDLKAIPRLESVELDWKHIGVLQLMKDLECLNRIHLSYDVNENFKAICSPSYFSIEVEYCSGLQICLTLDPVNGRHMGNLKLNKVSDIHFQSFLSESSQWLNPFFEKLHQFNVNSCPDLTTFVHSMCVVSFSNLKGLQISECRALNNLFTFSVAKTLIHLEMIRVQGCESMKEIVAKEQEEATSEGIIFEQLHHIYLYNLSSLECFYSGNATLQLPSLTQVIIQQCPKMEIVSHGSIEANSFKEIYSNDGPVFHVDLNSTVKKLFLQQDHLVVGDSALLQKIWLNLEPIPDWCFCNLKSLIIEECEFLSNAVLPSHLLPFLYNLKELQVWKCHSVKAIFDQPPSVAKVRLQKLHVINCDRLEEIVAKNDTAAEESNKELIIFPNLTSLRLWNLPNLKCIYSGMHVLKWPILKDLDVYHCQMLKCSATEFQNSPDSHPEDQDSFPTVRQAMISIEKVTPQLELLSLSKEEAMMIEQEKLDVDLQKLNSLRLHHFDDESDAFSFVFRLKKSLPTLKNLELHDSGFKEIFPSKNPEEDSTEILPQLKVLDLQRLSKLQSIGLEHSWMGPFIQNLENLFVSECNNLSNLTPSTITFSNLIKLNAKDCGDLKYLFTSSTARTLASLKEMEVNNCESIEEIVAEEGDDGEKKIENEIIFSKLEILTLSKLPKLGSFYTGSSTLNFRSLKQVSLTQCQNTKVFRHGDVVPKRLWVNIDGNDRRDIIDSLFKVEAA